MKEVRTCCVSNQNLRREAVPPAAIVAFKEYYHDQKVHQSRRTIGVQDVEF